MSDAFGIAAGGIGRDARMPPAVLPDDVGKTRVIQEDGTETPQTPSGGSSGAAPVFGFFDFAMDAATWATLEAGGDPGTYVIDRVTGGGAPAPGIYTLASATWTFVRALVPNELVEAQVAVDSSFTPEGTGPFLYCVQADGTLKLPGVVAAQVATPNNVGLLGTASDVEGSILQIEGYLDLDRNVADYIHSDHPDFAAWLAGAVGALPVGRTGYQFVDGDRVGVIGLTDTNWYGTTTATTLTFDNNHLHTGIGGTDPLTGGARLWTDSGVVLRFRDDTRPEGAEVFGTLNSTGVWQITRVPLSGSGAPADTLGEDGWTYEDTDNLDRYLKVSGTWMKFTLAGLV